MATLLELAQASDAAYDPSKSTLDGGTWSVIKTSENTESGYFGIAYKNNSTGEIIIANRGTRPDNIADLATNTKIVVNSVTDADRDAATFYDRVRGDNQTAKIYETGHSKGGNEAQYVQATRQGQDPLITVTWQAPGVATSALVPGVTYDVVNIRNTGDLISMVGQHAGGVYDLDAGPGVFSYIKNTALGFALGNGAGASAGFARTALDAHSMATTLQYLKEHPGLGHLTGDQFKGLAPDVKEKLASISAEQYDAMSVEQRKSLPTLDSNGIGSLLSTLPPTLPSNPAQTDTAVASTQTDGSVSATNLAGQSLIFKINPDGTVTFGETNIDKSSFSGTYFGSTTTSVEKPTFSVENHDANGNLIRTVSGSYIIDSLGSTTVKTVTKIYGNDQSPISTATTLENNSGFISQTVQANVGGNTINATYLPDGSGGLKLASIDSINGKPPADPDAVLAAFTQNGVTPEKLASGNIGDTALADINSAISAPTTLDVATIAALLNLILAVRSGQPLPIITSSVNLVSVFNPNNIPLAGAGAALGGISSLLALERSLQNRDLIGTANASAQIITYSAQLIAAANGKTLTAALGANIFGDATGFVQGVSEIAPYLNIANAIVKGDAKSAILAIAYKIHPVAGLVLTVLDMLGVFDDDRLPTPRGEGKFIANPDGSIGIAIGADYVGGGEVVNNFLQQFKTKLETLITDAKGNYPNGYGLVADRELKGSASNNFLEQSCHVAHALN